MPDPLGPLFDALESINSELTSFAARLARLEDAGAVRGASKPGGAGEDGSGTRAPGAPVVWHKVSDDERPALWSEFTSWVIRMADLYELTTEQLPHACWWEHGSVVAELTALWTGWESAYGNEEDAAASTYLWQDAWSRGIERIGRMWLGECTNGYHHEKSRTTWGTDPAYRKKIIEAGPPGTASKPTAA
ncbi:hypothetical protein AB0B04_19490 [Streptomyces xinghaiensis]|uniref:DUF4913 domain-containing protein n=2 Tax=Streptomyces TaxID=1883 RepID=A0A3R7F7R5_9ACTN|nr:MULTISPECIES: hypothetical protein [Streptomyces]KNE83364.1 hypothetical protein ADZ36_05970 [Streptomyces fradiae]OFA34138.1 hypothetical protein BEN35_30830 [Streptomyces fradiae]PQM20547.1 hypothetical protein Sfr7A_25440 [Streptomyces xinghaiensis]RKM92489.1 hypothetical protein SFRA_024095 [Streptomyces xinghaiensis]RNC70456.1 hypothetical protein DC095_025085 [Streptomyces xinghaiensis]